MLKATVNRRQLIWMTSRYILTLSRPDWRSLKASVCHNKTVTCSLSREGGCFQAASRHLGRNGVRTVACMVIYSEYTVMNLMKMWRFIGKTTNFLNFLDCFNSYRKALFQEVDITTKYKRCGCCRSKTAQIIVCNGEGFLHRSHWFRWCLQRRRNFQPEEQTQTNPTSFPIPNTNQLMPSFKVMSFITYPPHRNLLMEGRYLAELPPVWCEPGFAFLMAGCDIEVEVDIDIIIFSKLDAPPYIDFSNDPCRKFTTKKWLELSGDDIQPVCAI